MTCAQPNSHFLAEWYWPDARERSFDAAVTRLVDLAAASGPPVHLLVTVLVACDEVAFGIFDAQSAASVADLCGRAGLPAQRLTPVVNTRFPSGLRAGSVG
jgi:hypothetical protein